MASTHQLDSSVRAQKGRYAKRRRFERTKKWLAGTAAASLVASLVVFAGFQAQEAHANPFTPGVSVDTGNYLAGEDLNVSVTVSSGESDAPQYNLSFGVLIPADMTLVDSATLGSPRIAFGPGESVTSNFAPSSDADCDVLGLEFNEDDEECVVPDGKQYLVFQNISDLPTGASATHNLTLRPNASTFGVGTDFDIHVTAFTSALARYIPTFPGSTGVAAENTHTSAGGFEVETVNVNALRIEKREPSPESELLRGVHENTTTYTLRVYHTGEGNISDVEVVDFLPAGLEYLGRADIQDNSRSGLEYAGAPSLSATPDADGDHRAWPTAGEKSVTTVIPTAEEVAKYGLASGQVYTKVVWDLETLLATDDDRDMRKGIAQTFDTDAGVPGYLEIHYRAGIPLFENTMDFAGSDGTYTPATDGEQAANLDNNNGASTRHGVATGAANADQEGAQAAQSLTNVAAASGTYPGVADPVEDHTAHTVDAVDVRVVKSVDNSTFKQGTVAQFTLDIATSEYVTAEQLENVNNYLHDDMGDGICPAFIAGTTQVTGGATFSVDGEPSADADAWNTTITQAPYDVDADCEFPSLSGGELEGAVLAGINFNSSTGRFSVGYVLDDANQDIITERPNERIQVTYFAALNETYVNSGGQDGATTSGDIVENDVSLVFTTTPRSETAQMEGIGGDFNAFDDSTATLTTELTKISKKVLERSSGVPGVNRDDLTDENLEWVDAATEPFTAGDVVWWKITVDPPAGIDLRNPRMVDFLPEAVEFDPAELENGRYANIFFDPQPGFAPLGDCNITDPVAWLNKFVPIPAFDAEANSLTWEFGATDCIGNGQDRFMPILDSFDIYIKTTVVGVTEFEEVDFPENLVKYQQNNVNGDVFFLRDSASMEIGHQTHLLKGIKSITDSEATVPSEKDGRFGADFNGNIDGLQVKQDDQVRFRIDLAAPEYDTSSYVIWDALPEGIVASDLDLSEANAYLWDGEEFDAPTGSFTVEAFDPGADNRPTEVASEYSDRTIVVWTFDNEAVVPGDPEADADPTSGTRTGLSLEYTVTIPGPGAVFPAGFEDAGEPRAALIQQKYKNTASIVSYQVPRPGGTPSLHRPESPISTQDPNPSNGDIGIPGVGTFDDSDVFLGSVEVEKELVATEISTTDDVNQGSTDIVQGEFTTFRYSVEIPKHTTVHKGELFDLGNFVGRGEGTIEPANSFQYKLHSAVLPAGEIPAEINVVDVASGADPEAHETNFYFRTDSGKLIFPEYYSTGTQDRTFTVEIVVWTADVDASHEEASASRPEIPHAKILRNTADFYAADASGTSSRVDRDTEDVRYVEPELNISKNAAPSEDVSLGQPVTYTLTVSNGEGHPASYDNVVVDTVPAGLIVDPEQDLLEDATITDDDKVTLAAGLGGTIIWSHETISALKKITDAADVELSYEATIDPATGGGQQYENTAGVTGYTLPETLPNTPDQRRGDRTSEDTETITATTAAISKGVRIGSQDDYTDEVSAPIGQTVEYEVLVTLHPNINYYDPIIRDTMQPGMALVSDSIDGPIEVDVNGEPLDSADVTVGGTWTKDVSGNAHTWTYNGDIEDASETRYLLMTYQVEMSDAVPFNVNALPNIVDFSWNSVDDDESTRVPDIEDNANVEVLNPRIATAKSVSHGTPNPGETFTYTVTFTNNGSTPAYNMTFVDTIPENVIVSESSITGDGVLTGTDGDRGNSGGTITWEPDGPLSNVAPNNSVTYTYEAKLVASELIRDDEPVADLTNTVIVDRYESFPEGGRDYEPGGEEPGTSATAVINPPFPHVVPSKSVTTTDVAYEGVPLSWTLTFKNTGDGPVRDISVEDVLPLNWNYEEGSAQIRWNGASSWTDLGDPVVVQSDVGDEFRETLTWDKAEIRSKSAFPSELTRPILAAHSGTGTAPYLEIRFSAIPTTAALTEAGVTEDDGTRVPHVNTVTAIAEDMSGATGNESRPTYAPGHGEDEAYIHAVDLHLQKEAIGGTATDGSGEWIAGQAVGDGYTQPQWKITITNQGPDAALGQFRVLDTVTEPEGVDTGPFSARYFADAADTVGTPITLTGSGTPGDPYLVGAHETSLQPDGSDRIELIANVTIAADATGTAQNEADVAGRTYEPEDKITDGTNEDEATKTLTTLADLTINKAVNTLNPRAGENITWQLDVRNLGPSVSVSSDDTPITVNDTVPAGITVTQNPSTTLWTATVDGAAFPAEGVTGGTEIVWVYQGDEMPVNVTSSILLTGMIDPAWEPNAVLTNEAQVVPGETEDPNFGTSESNNEDTVTVTPGTTTSLGIAKTRVVQQGSGWTNAVDLDPVPPIVPGESVSYRIDVVNNGPAVARNVTVVDETPDGFTYTGIHDIPGSTWNWLDTGAAPTENQTFALSGNQAVGPTNMKSFVVTFDTDEALDVSQPVVNTAIADAENSTNQPEDDDSSNSERNGNLFIEKTHSGNAVAGSTLPYTITVTNEGPSVSGGPIEVTDTLPGGFSFVTGSATASVAGGAAQATDTTLTVLDDGKQHLAWTIGDTESTLAVGATIVITFTSAIDPTLGAQTGLINYATVDGPDNNDPSDDTDEDPTDVETRANMSITKLVEDGPWVAGTEVEYLLTVTNEGPSALDATVTDVLPAGLVPVSMEGIGAGNAWDCSATSCFWETYPVGSSQILVTAFIESGVEQDTDLLNTATVSWEDSDGPHEDSDDEEIHVSIIADLGLQKHVLATPSSTEWVDANGADDAATAVAGEWTSFKLTVSNEGPSDAIAPLVVTDTLPQGVAFDTITVGEGWEADYDVDTNVVTFTNESTGIAYGADPLEIEYSVTLAPAMEIGVVTNEAEITAETLDANNDGNPENNADPANVDVEREIDVGIVKTHNPDVVRIGDELPFALEVTNNGPSNASGVTVTDTVPAGLDVVVDTEALPVEAGEGWTIDAVTVNEDGTTTVVASYADELEPFEVAPILTITTLVTPVAYETVTNVAVVDTTEPDRVPENNTTEDPVLVPPMVTLVVEKTAVGEFQVGKTGTYRITVENFGPTADPGPITVTDVLPNGLTFHSSPDETVDVNGTEVTWTIEEGLAVDERVELTLVVNVHQAAYPSVTNVVSIESPAEKTPESVLSDDETIEVKAADPLAVTGGELALSGLLALLIVLMLGGGAALMIRRRSVEA